MLAVSVRKEEEAGATSHMQLRSIMITCPAFYAEVRVSIFVGDSDIYVVDPVSHYPSISIVSQLVIR